MDRCLTNEEHHRHFARELDDDDARRAGRHLEECEDCARRAASRRCRTLSVQVPTRCRSGCVPSRPPCWREPRQPWPCPPTRRGHLGTLAGIEGATAVRSRSPSGRPGQGEDELGRSSGGPLPSPPTVVLCRGRSHIYRDGQPCDHARATEGAVPSHS